MGRDRSHITGAFPRIRQMLRRGGEALVAQGIPKNVIEIHVARHVAESLLLAAHEVNLVAWSKNGLFWIPALCSRPFRENPVIPTVEKAWVRPSEAFIRSRGYTTVGFAYVPIERDLFGGNDAQL